MKIALVLILTWFIFKPHVAISQIKLPTGLYKLDDSGNFIVTIDGKIYHTNGQPLATIKHMKNFNVTEDGTKKDFYNLNFELNAEAIKNLKYITPFDYSKPNHIGLIVNGELMAAPVWSAPITANKISISSSSKVKLDQIAEKLKAEQIIK